MTVQDPDGASRKIMLGRDRLVLLMQAQGEGVDLDFVAHVQDAIEQALK
jgi:hypothetical protein